MTASPAPQALLVVGGGVIGWSVAARLAERDHDVTLVTDADGDRSAVSAASLAWAGAHGKDPGWYGALNRDGRARHEQLSALGAGWFHRTGAARDGRVATEDGYVDDLAYVAAQRAALTAHGGRVLLGTRVHGLRREAGGIVADTASGPLRADAVVVAAGTGTAALVRGLGATGRIGTAAGPTGFLARVRADALGPVPRIADDGGLRVRPDRDGVVAVQWQRLEDEAAASGRPLDEASVWPPLRDRLAEAFGREVPADALLSVHAAPRPMPADGLPVVGWVAERVYTVLTHSGMTLAALLSELAARDIDGDEDARLRPLRPDRMQEAGASRSEED